MNPQETIRERQTLFITYKKSALFRGRLRIAISLWASLLALFLLLAQPNAAFAQSALTDDANVNCSSNDDDDDHGKESVSTNTGGGGSNCGGKSSLSLSSSGKVYIKFRLSSTLPANTPGSDVARATLKLYLRDVAAAGTIDIYIVAGVWSEKTITAHNAPPLGSVIAAGVPVQQSMKDQFLIIDLTSAVQQWLGTDGAGTGGVTNHGVALVARNGARATFDSKENTQTSHEPQLSIQRRGSAGQPGPQGQTGPQGPKGPKGDKGDPGAQGPAGVQGPQGATGAQGPQGPTGAVGPQGPQGNTGATGATGAPGPQGPTGTQGPQGATGPVGPQGAQGAKGLNWKGAWDAGANYVTDDAVSHSGSSWRALVANMNVTPVEGVEWTIIAEKGDDGEGSGTVTSVSANGPITVTNPTTTPDITLGLVPTTFGGTGLTSAGAQGSFLRSDGSAWTSAPLAAPDIPAGSEHYIQNSTSQQSSTNFSIGGTGTANVFDAATQFSLGGQRILSNAGTNNLFAGTDAGASNATGTANAFFGKSAGFANTTGSSNSFFGFNAGRNTTSSHNSFFGDAAGFNNTTGGSSFFGFLAGFRNTTGIQNSFFGRGTGADNTTGNSNSFFGDGAGSRNISGSTNSFFGFATGFFNTTGSNNAFVGGSAGDSNTTGSANAFFGEAAGSGNITGSNNSFFGRGAGFFNTTGSNNVFSGLNAGRGNTAGSNITIIGTNANVGADNLDHATVIGADAVVGSSNTVVLGRSADSVQIPGALNVSGSIGANILNATTRFDLGGSRILSRTQFQNLFAGVESGPNATGIGNVFFGPLSGLSATTATNNSFFGLRAGATSTGSGNSFFGTLAGGNFTGAGSNNTFIGHNADFTVSSAPGSNNTLLGANAKIEIFQFGQNLSFATAIGAGATVQFSDMVVIGKPAGTYDGVSRPADIVRTMGIFQPALSSPGGNPVCFNNGLSLCSSSFRYKTAIQRYLGGVDVAKRLNPITFAWKDDGRRDIGFGAEEVAKVEPLLTFTNDKGEIEGVHYAQITTVLVNAVKEQQAQIEVMTKQIENLTTLVCRSNLSTKICREKEQPK